MLDEGHDGASSQYLYLPGQRDGERDVYTCAETGSDAFDSVRAIAQLTSFGRLVQVR